MAYFLVLPALASAQSNYATLRGSITDPQNRPVESALIALKSLSTEAVRKTTADSNGFFEIAGLAPDDYQIDASAPGLTTVSRRLRLEVAQQTVPGSHVSHGAQTGDMNPLYWRPGQSSAISVRGNRPNANLFLLDGNTDTDLTFNMMNLSPSPDGVEEFQVQTSSYLAEMANYTFAKDLTDAPDFRSPMFEAAIPQNNSDLAAEKGPGCDVRHRWWARCTRFRR